VEWEAETGQAAARWREGEQPLCQHVRGRTAGGPAPHDLALPPAGAHAPSAPAAGSAAAAAHPSLAALALTCSPGVHARPRRRHGRPPARLQLLQHSGGAAGASQPPRPPTPLPAAPPRAAHSQRHPVPAPGAQLSCCRQLQRAQGGDCVHYHARQRAGRLRGRLCLRLLWAVRRPARASPPPARLTPHTPTAAPPSWQATLSSLWAQG